MKRNFPILESLALKGGQKNILVFEVERRVYKPYWHYHPEIELTLITKGKGIRFVGDSIEKYQAFDLVLIGENVPHHWVSQDHVGEEINQAIVIHFDPRIFQEIGELQGLFQFIQSAKGGYHFPQVEEEMVQKFKRLDQIPDALKISWLIDVLYGLMHHKSPRMLSKTTKFNIPATEKDQGRMNEVIQYIVGHLNQKLTVSQMAEKNYMVPQAFCRWFRKHTGYSFISYLNKTRIESACQYLLTSDFPIKRIAFEVGFGNISHFNRTFKQYVGVSPLNYKKQHLKER